METSSEYPSKCNRTIMWSVVSNPWARSRQWRWSYPSISCFGYDSAHPCFDRECQSFAEWEKFWITQVHQSKYAKGEFPEAGKEVFGSKFAKEIVGDVEADTAICKASAIVNKGSRWTSSKEKSPSSLNPTFFDGARLGGMALPPAGATSAHATNWALSVDEQQFFQQVRTKSQHNGPTCQTEVKIGTNHFHAHTYIAGNISTMESPNPGPMDPPGGGRIPDRFLVSTPSRQLMFNVQDGQTSTGGLGSRDSGSLKQRSSRKGQLRKTRLRQPDVCSPQEGRQVETNYQLKIPQSVCGETPLQDGRHQSFKKETRWPNWTWRMCISPYQSQKNSYRCTGGTNYSNSLAYPLDWAAHPMRSWNCSVQFLHFWGTKEFVVWCIWTTRWYWGEWPRSWMYLDNMLILGRTTEEPSSGGVWNTHETTLHINCKELLAAWLGLQCYASTLQDVRAHTSSDTQHSSSSLCEQNGRSAFQEPVPTTFTSLELVPLLEPYDF